MQRLALPNWGIVFLLLLLAGLAQHQIGAQVQQTSANLQALRATMVTERERLFVLQAEWAYLSRPARLRELVARHLPLRPMALAQIRTQFPITPAQAPVMLADGGQPPARPTVSRQQAPSSRTVTRVAQAQPDRLAEVLARLPGGR